MSSAARERLEISPTGMEPYIVASGSWEWSKPRTWPAIAAARLSTSVDTQSSPGWGAAALHSGPSTVVNRKSLALSSIAKWTTRPVHREKVSVGLAITLG